MKTLRWMAGIIGLLLINHAMAAGLEAVPLQPAPLRPAQTQPRTTLTPAPFKPVQLDVEMRPYEEKPEGLYILDFQWEPSALAGHEKLLYRVYNKTNITYDQDLQVGVSYYDNEHQGWRIAQGGFPLNVLTPMSIVENAVLVMQRQPTYTRMRIWLYQGSDPHVEPLTRLEVDL